ARYLVQELRAGGRDDVEVVVLAGAGMRNENRKPEEGPAGAGPASAVRSPQSALEKPLPLAFERVLDLAQHPVLADHVLDGPPVPPPNPLPELRPYPRGPAEIYQDVLFHGPELRAIEQVEGASERGIVASVRTAPPPASWVRQPLRQRWVTDPLVLDAAFQLM